MNAVNVARAVPAGIPGATQRGALNNNLAWAYASGDPRAAAKKYDRPGLSRGGAQWNQAGIDSAQQLASGIADAYSQDIQNRIFNSQTNLQGNQGREQFAQALGALQQQNDYANQMAGLQRQGSVYGLLGGLLQGMF